MPSSPALTLLVVLTLRPGGGLIAQARADGEVPVVRNSGADTLLPWRAEPLWAVGGMGDTWLTLPDARAVRVASHARTGTFVLDAQARKVHRLSSTGEVMDSLGGRGRGPGELATPVWVTFDRAGNLAVFDRGKGAFVRWSAAGEALAEWRAGAFVLGPEVEFMAGGIVYRGLRRDALGLEGYDLTLLGPDGSRRVLAQAPPILWRTADFPACNAYRLTVSPLFSHDLPWAGRGDVILAAVVYSYSILVIERHRAEKRIVRDVPARRVTREIALRELAAGWTVNDCQVPPESLREIGHAEFVPAIARLRIAPSGEIWVDRGRVADEERRTDLFSPGGRYLGTLGPDVPFPDAFLSDDSFLAISTDRFDVPVVTAYRIVGR